MPRLKVLTVFGTRPEAVKLGPVIRELARHPDRIASRVCVTAQHRDMLDQVLRIFGIQPDHDLDVMQDNQTPDAGRRGGAGAPRADPARPSGRTGCSSRATRPPSPRPRWRRSMPARRVGHVEAGLRTGDRWQPFPEEINRRVAGVIADRHFAPTTRSRDNLLREDVPPERILVTGNTGIDALRWITAQPESRRGPRAAARVARGPRRSWSPRIAARTSASRCASICLALRELAERYAGAVRIVYPVHRNPNVWGPVHELLGDVPNITLLPPLDYLPNLQLMKRAYLVITDSGGIQEEATGLGMPALVLREVTERPEGVATGALRIVGTDRARIVAEASRLLDDPAEYARMAHAENPFGDGHAAERIVASLLERVPADADRELLREQRFCAYLKV